ncbi:MarR family transcriptional regulator [Flavobacterium suaedae]|uniref:MarR family transcriptional regulator n=1 Tax=Flavobacterium suaedae TaxID=1767027 RepID=A0ABQ1K1A5_9FLAO|nr:MarR family transcriptional regulator [Flavobacterium suaedae]GGB80663.1 MarR family transcriptional regulator [Flavobacterium suaedae]
MEKEIDPLKLENQICFPLYTASRLLTQCYQPMLKKFGITYPQYLVLLVLWEKDSVNLSYIAEKLFLQSNTLTPLLKRMEEQDLVKRVRSHTDERSIVITLTEKGREMRQEAEQIPAYMAEQLPITKEEAMQMYNTLYKMIEGL